MDLAIEPYRDRDAELVSACLTSAARLDATLEPISAEAWRSFAGMSFNTGGRDFRVARDGERIVAVLMSARYEERGAPIRNVRAIVHPEFRRRGIATRLAALVDEQDPDGRATLQASTMGAWTVGARMLERRGCTVAHRQLWMRLAEARPLPPAAPDAGVRRSDESVADLHAWTRLRDEGFRDDPDFVPLGDADRDAQRRADRFQLWLAESRAEPTGYCHVAEFGGEGFVEGLVVAERHRGRGLGRALLLAGCRALREERPGPIRLNVFEHNAAAVALYRAIGFETSDTIETWRRPPAAP